jgi:hypothetical protein
MLDQVRANAVAADAAVCYAATAICKLLDAKPIAATMNSNPNLVLPVFCVLGRPFLQRSKSWQPSAAAALLAYDYAIQQCQLLGAASDALQQQLHTGCFQKQPKVLMQT